MTDTSEGTSRGTLALLIGATSATGREIISQARAEGLAVRALARNPARLEGGLSDEVVQGDVLDPASLERAVKGADVVISVFGSPLTQKPVTLLSEGTRNLVTAMRGAGVRRLLCVTGIGAGDSRGHGGILYDWFVRPIILRTIYADKDRQEQVVRESGLDWVLIRPAVLVNKPRTGTYREITQLEGERLGTISRADVAHFLVREALSPRYSQQVVNLTY